MEKESKDKLKKSNSFRKKFVDYYKNYIQYIEKRNKKFNALSREKRIVALCQDAIYHILTGTIKPTSGTYLHLIEPKNDLLVEIKSTEENSLSDIKNVACSLISEGDNKKRNTENFYLEKEQFQTAMPLVECQACAKGGLMVAAISFKNKLIIGDCEIDSPDLPKMLKDDFTKLEWDLIEICFERWSVDDARTEKYFSSKMMKVDKIFNDLLIKAPKAKNEFYQERDEIINYGVAYAMKHLNASKYECDDEFQNNNNFLIHEKVESLLLQIYCTIIAHRGDIFKALNLNNNKVIDYTKVITDAKALYPAFKTKKELNARIKELTKFIRKKPLSLKELSDTIAEEIFYNTLIDGR